MSNENQKAAESRSKPASGKPVAAPSKPPAPSAPAVPTGPFFRRVDWITFGITTLLAFIGYWLTLAPDLTLEDSGELAVGSYYAGVPHPPGYPVWTLYTWLFTHIPHSNIAWRVALSSAVAAAFACGLLALMVSRGSSLLMEGIPELKNIEAKWENALCVVSGFVAGMLLAFNGFMWSQAVIVEVYTLSVLSFMGVLCCLMRWIYSPEQRKYLYWALFWFGICFTNHQTLIVAAMGIEIAVLAAQPKLGRDMFIGNSVVYLLGLVAKGAGVLTSFDNNLPLFMLYNVVGLGSLAVAVVMIFKTGKALTEWKPVTIMLGLWLLGAAFYFYMPLASMSNPPMNWGYPRTVEGFKHALTRGQYDKTNPTDDVGRFFSQIWMYIEGAIEEFTLVYLLLGVIPFLFYKRMQKRERAWLVGLAAIGICLAGLLLILLNPNTDKQSQTQSRVFFTSSHIVLAIATGYGLTIIGALMAIHYEKFRRLFLIGAAVASGIEFFYLFKIFDGTQLPTIRYAAVLGLVLAGGFTLSLLLFRKRASLPIVIALFALIPARSILSHWADNEQRGHLFGYWFGHDMFTPPFSGTDGKPLYPEMTKNAILFGGTDPGRFNPTYMIFCESFLPAKYKRDPNFDRRDVYLITQNALADLTYLDYIRAHYNRSTQKDPYFFSELVRSARERDEGRTNLLAKALLPIDRYFTDLGEKIEKRRRDEGVYPPKEIHTPSPEESQRAFNEYIMDAQRRLQHDMQFPNEPRQIKPGEDVRIVDNRVQVQGQVAVMAINGLLTKVIFDQNPDHEFFVEESFPLDWMFPYLTPYGIIMKINRQPVSVFTEDTLNRDHQFWSQYSDRLIGNWITYDTSIKEICAFAEKTYLRHDFSGFKGDPKFVRDEFAQKAFSKLRSAIGGIYSWRLGPDCPLEFRPKTVEEQQRLLREADFALRQSYAFCPYSPEAVQKYIMLSLSTGRVEDALLVAETSLKFDPSNTFFQSWVGQLKQMGRTRTQVDQLQNQFVQIEEQYRSNPNNMQLGMQLADAYLQMGRLDGATKILDQISTNDAADVSTLLTVAQNYARLGNRPKVDLVLTRLQTMREGLEKQYRQNTNDVPTAFQLISVLMITQQTNEAIQVVDSLVARPNPDPSTLLSAAQVYLQVSDISRLEQALNKLVAIVPDNAEAWYDLATVQASIGKPQEAMKSLANAITLSDKRLELQPGSKDLRSVAAVEGRFVQLRSNPEFKKLVSKK